MFTATSKIEIVIRKQLFLQSELGKYVCMYKQTYFSSILSIVFKHKFPLHIDFFLRTRVWISSHAQNPHETNISKNLCFQKYIH